jgi:hypothetical protein
VLPEASKRKHEHTSLSAPIGRHSPQAQHETFLQLAVRSVSELSLNLRHSHHQHIQQVLAISFNVRQTRLPSAFKLPLESVFRNQIQAMVIFGGLELVAAGVILHKLNKGKEREQELEREQDRRSRERRHDRKHHRRRDSPQQHIRKEHNLYPPQSQPPRAQSAPPPGYAPNWQPQPMYYPPQPWQPQQTEKTPAWHRQPNNYPPTWQAQAPPQSRSHPYPQPQPQPNMYSTPHHDDAALSELLQRGPPQSGNQSGGRPQPRPTATAPPDPNYAELSADSPGNYNTKPNVSPHVSFAVPEDERRNDYHNDPPPAYQDYRPE